MCHGPEAVDFLAASIALVDIEATVESLCWRKQIQERHMETIMDVANNLYFAERTWRRLEEEVREFCPELRGISTALKASHIEVKRLNALEMLDKMARWGELGAPQSQRYWPPATPAFRAMLARSSKRGVTANT